MNRIDECQRALGYRFKNPKLLELALTHKSLHREPARSNERLEYLGDAVLSMAVTQHLYLESPNRHVGDMTQDRAKIVSRNNCEQVGQRLGLRKFIRGRKKDQITDRVLGDAVEATIGAIYLDGHFAAACEFVNQHFLTVVDTSDVDSKSQLQKHMDKHNWGRAIYRLMGTKGPEHGKLFLMEVKFRDLSFLSDWESTKQKAEQSAAKAALDFLISDNRDSKSA